MTATRLVTIFCDADNCGMWDDAGVADTAVKAREQLRGTGWTVGVLDPSWRMRRDYCPRHKPSDPVQGDAKLLQNPGIGDDAHDHADGSGS